MIKGIKAAVTIPVMAKARIGHFVEAQACRMGYCSCCCAANVSFRSTALTVCCCLLSLMQILEALGIDYIDESEVLTPADDVHHINKHAFKVRARLGRGTMPGPEGTPLVPCMSSWSFQCAYSCRIECQAEECSDD